MTIKARTDLALSLVVDHFGAPSKKICSVLLQHGSISISDIMKFSGLPFEIVRNSILSMVQHDVIGFNFDPSTADKPTLYNFLVDNVNRRIRYPAYLNIVERRVGLVPRLLLFELMKHGRMRVDDCIGAVEAHIDFLLEQDPSIDFGCDASRESLLEAFVDLIMVRGARRVHKANSSSAYQSLAQKEQETKARRAANIKANAAQAQAQSKKDQENETKSGKQLATRMGQASGGFLLNMNDEGLGGDMAVGGGLGDLIEEAAKKRTAKDVVGELFDSASEEESKPKRRTLTRRKKTGNKFTDDDLDALHEAERDTGKSLLAGLTGDGVFCPDLDGLDEALLQQEMIALLTARLGGRPLNDAILTSLVLEKPSTLTQGKTLPEISAAVARQASETTGERASILKTVERASVEKFLDTASLLADHLVDKTERRPATGRGTALICYDVNKPAVTRALRARVLASAVRSRAGSQGLRVFNLLRQAAQGAYPEYPSGKMEDKAVTDKCLLAPRAARTTLMSLLNNGFIQAQDLSKIAIVPGAQKGQVFFVREEQAAEKLHESVYKTLHNLRTRLEHENKGLVAHIRRGGDPTQLESRMIAEDILDLNICKVDEALLILSRL